MPSLRAKVVSNATANGLSLSDHEALEVELDAAASPHCRHRSGGRSRPGDAAGLACDSQQVIPGASGWVVPKEDCSNLVVMMPMAPPPAVIWCHGHDSGVVRPNESCKDQMDQYAWSPCLEVPRHGP